MSVYAWGANSHGQLGLGFESELCKKPQRLNQLSFSPQSIRCIRGGGGHVLVLETLGRVHACGWNNRGQLGLDSNEIGHNEFQCIPREFFEDVAIEYIACGWDISGCITATKKLYVWGSNSHQQLGICPREFTAVRRPLKVLLPRNEQARLISFGLRHCAILTEENVVYVFGRLRVDDPQPLELNITTVTLNRTEVLRIVPAHHAEIRITGVINGQNHLLLKISDKNTNSTSTKRIIALGDNKYGQANTFQFDTDIKHLSVGWTHNAALLKSNKLLLWGRNCYGQLGIGVNSPHQPIPTEIELPENKIPARIHLGAEHSLLRTKCGEIYTWGWNEHGNCGNDSTENVLKPTLINLPTVVKLAGTGAGFCFVITEN